jgi:hypothetical protein
MSKSLTGGASGEPPRPNGWRCRVIMATTSPARLAEPVRLGGYFLHHANDEKAGRVIGAGHCILGLGVSALLFWHLVSGRKPTRISETPLEPMENRA